MNKSMKWGSLRLALSVSLISETSFCFSSAYFPFESCLLPMQFLLARRLKENMQSWQAESPCE